MVRVVVSSKKIEIIGHSGFDNIGKDIVCSAISSIVITTINGIISIDSDAIIYEQENDKMVITIKKDNEITNKLITNMIDLLKELSISYPKNINVKEK